MAPVTNWAVPFNTKPSPTASATTPNSGPTKAATFSATQDLAEYPLGLCNPLESHATQTRLRQQQPARRSTAHADLFEGHNPGTSNQDRHHRLPRPPGSPTARVQRGASKVSRAKAPVLILVDGSRPDDLLHELAHRIADHDLLFGQLEVVHHRYRSGWRSATTRPEVEELGTRSGVQQLDEVGSDGWIG